MTSPDTERSRIIGLRVGTVTIVALLVRVVVAGVLIARADAVADEGVRRYDRVAAAPVTPYRNFAVEWMPVQTALVQIVGGDGDGATAARVMLLAVVADAAVAGALAWGWSRRVAATYLVLGLPLLAVAYVRLDLIAVALAAWAFALARRERDGPAGATLGLAALSGPWAAFLLPWAVLRRRRPAVVGALSCLLLGGAAWFVVGGPKGPMQVLSYRGATGWDVQGTVGVILDAFTGGATFLEGGILRIGYAPAWARTILLLAIVAAVATAWLRWRPGRQDAAAGIALAITVTILALSPTYPAAWTSIVVPWAALAWDEERWLVVGAVVAIALTGILSSTADPARTSSLTIAIVLARQAVLVLAAARALVSRDARQVV